MILDINQVSQINKNFKGKSKNEEYQKGIFYNNTCNATNWPNSHKCSK